jgi:hypothetical protein
LIEQGEQEMLVRYFRLIEIGSEALRCLQRFLHLLRISIRSHSYN